MNMTVVPKKIRRVPLLLAVVLLAVSCARKDDGRAAGYSIGGLSPEDSVRSLFKDCDEEQVRSLMGTLRAQSEDLPREVFGLQVYFAPPSQYGYTDHRVVIDSPVLKQIEELHDGLHLGQVPYGSAAWDAYAQYFGTEKEDELCTECPFCRYQMRHGTPAESRVVGGNESEGIWVSRYDVLAGDMGFLAARKKEVSDIQSGTSASVARSREVFLKDFAVISAPSVNAAEINRAYDGNSIAAEEKYEGKLFRITGIIDDIGMASPAIIVGDRVPHMTVGEQGWFGITNMVSAFFTGNASGDFTGYSHGDKVTFVGTVRTGVFMPQVVDCTLYAPGMTASNSGSIREGMLAVLIDSMRLRSSAGTASAVIASLGLDTFVTVLEVGKEAVIDGIASNWVRVRVEWANTNGSGSCPAGTEGWCFGGYLYDYGIASDFLHFSGFEYGG